MNAVPSLQPSGHESRSPTPAAAADPGIPELVSIVIPCYKGSRFLAAAIESCLAQTYRDIELIVVDDASPDDCAAIAARYATKDRRLRLIRRPTNGGIARAFNTGFASARGEYFTRLAQDDLFQEDAIEIMRRELAADPKAGLVYCDCQMMDAAGTVVDYRRTSEPEEALAHDNRVGTCVMWRRTVWQAVGEFDPSFDTAEDYEYWLRLSKRFPLRKCRDVAPFYIRVHDTMNTKVQAVRQEIATARAQAKYSSSRLEARRCLSEGHCRAAYTHRARGWTGRALWHLTVAVAYWPFAWMPYRGLAALALGRRSWQQGSPGPAASAGSHP